MDGRWKFWLMSGLICTTIGCKGGMFSKNKSPSDFPKQQPEVEERVQKGPLKPETILAFGHAALDAADPKYVRSQPERERLLNESLKHYTQVLEKQPKNIEALAGMAKASFYLGDTNKADETYRMVLQMEPRNAQVWFEYSWVQSKLLKDPHGAVESLNEATRLDPTNTVCRRWLGRTLALANRTEEGVQVLMQNMSEAEARYEVAEMLNLTGNSAGCRKQLQLALQADPSFTLAREVLTEMTASMSTRGPTETQPVGYEEPMPNNRPVKTPPARIRAMENGTPNRLPENILNDTEGK
jgi:tetratricopeptide (TPR) repeat protein